jgi:hypothetical protein
VLKKGTSLASSLGREERTVGKVKILLASCLWIAAIVTPSWAVCIDETPLSREYVQSPSSHPHPFSLSEETNFSPYIYWKGLRLSPMEASHSSVMNETDEALQGVKAYYKLDFWSCPIEFSGGYAPRTKSLLSSEAPFNVKAHSGYIDLRIPLSQFYVQGGAFFGQNLEALDLVFKRPPEEQNLERDFLGYQIGGGYRFSDSLIIQAGWGQAGQEYETAKEGLRVWYLRAQIILGWQMSVTPQVGYIDSIKEDGEKIREEAFYCGARWQINF